MIEFNYPTYEASDDDLDAQIQVAPILIIQIKVMVGKG